MRKDNIVYAGQMLDMCRKTADKVGGKSRAEFDRDENLLMAIAHIIQIIGEAARNVEDDFQKAHPEIPWAKVIGMRHKVVHDYMDVNYDIVGDVATVEIPSIVPVLEKIVKPPKQ